MSSGHKNRGFTLIEILVALVVVSISLIAALGAVGTLTDSAGSLRQRSAALWSAENRLAKIRVEGIWPSPGKTSFDCSQGGIALRCEEEVLATPNPFFRRVEIDVFETSKENGKNGPRLAHLTGFATNLPSGG
jgi:general secretion pathway protein I